MAKENIGEDALFANIVYRLDYPENKVPWVKKWLYWFSAISLGSVFLLSIVIQFVSADHIFWIDIFVHALFESYCGIIAFIIAYIIHREYKSSGKRGNLFLFLAFFSMGTFDFFHAYSNHCVTLFVWFHTLSAFSGGGFFLWSIFSIRNGTKDPPWLRRLFVAFGMAAPVVSGAILWKYFTILPNAIISDIAHHMPVTLPVRGEFAGHLVVVNILAALFFLIAGIYFLRFFKTANDVLYHIFSLASFLFFESEVLFVFSTLWDPTWWYWHTIKLIIYVGLVIGLAHGLTRTFRELRESRTTLTGTVEELRCAYRNLEDTQEELVEAEKLASIGKMAATIAHEIRNPLGAINNSIGIFKRHTQLIDDDRELLDIVENEIERLNGIITDFLDYSRPSLLSTSLTDVNSLIDETLLFFTSNGHANQPVKIAKSFDGKMPFVRIDVNAFKQCLWNIFINAMQAMPAGGMLSIKTRWSPEHGAEEEFGKVAILISDGGAGMTEETLSRAFHPFYSTKAKGTGLGLAIVQKIVRQHGGNVSLRSTRGRGTDVEITIPVDYRKNIMKRGVQDVVSIDSR